MLLVKTSGFPSNIKKIRKHHSDIKRCDRQKKKKSALYQFCHFNNCFLIFSVENRKHLKPYSPWLWTSILFFFFISKNIFPANMRKLKVRIYHSFKVSVNKMLPKMLPKYQGQIILQKNKCVKKPEQHFSDIYCGCLWLFLARSFYWMK